MMQDTTVEERGVPLEPLAQTYHSNIELCHCEGHPAVLKRSRRLSDERTVVRYRQEVKALKRVAERENVCAASQDQALAKLCQYKIHIAKIYDSDSSALTITLRLERGQSLCKYVNEEMRCTLNTTESSTLWKQMAGALAWLHQLDVIHDDVKPENIMWSGENARAVLIDFGAALIDVPEDYFNPSGTPNYAAPEFLLRQKSPKGDVWSLGITMLFAYGHIPLPDGTWLLPAAIHEGSDANRQMLDWLAEVEGIRCRGAHEQPLLAKMLEQNPQTRFSSSELLNNLNETV